MKTAQSVEQRAKSQIINQNSPQSRREHGEELDRINRIYRITKHSLKIGGGGKGFTSQASHSTLPFEGLRVLSKVEGLMALSETLSWIEGSEIEGLIF